MTTHDLDRLFELLVRGRQSYEATGPFDEYLAGQVNGADRMRTILTLNPSHDAWWSAMQGWLPSAYWDEFCDLWDAIHE